MMLDVSLLSQSSFEASERQYLFWFAVLFGFVFLASLSSILIWLNSDDDLFVYYALYLALDLVLIVAIYGFWTLVLPVGSNDLILGVTQTVIVFPLLVIIARVSNFPKYFPFLYRVLLLQTILLSLFGPFFIVLGYFQPVIHITHVFVMLLSALWFGMSLLLLKKEPMAPFVLIVFIAFLIGSISSYAMHVRLLPLNFITQNLILFGFVLQALLLYVVLGYRMHYLLQDKNEFEARAQSVEDEVVQRRLFMNMLNHELRTPMAIIDSAARNLLAQSDRSSVMTKQRLEKIGLAVSDMRHLMDLCLATDRLCFINNDNQSCSLDKLLESVLGHVSYRHDAERVLYEGLDEDIRILGDEPLLVLAISTVLDNALNYSESDQDVLLQVSRPSKALVRLTIVDKGRGFDKNFELGKRQRGENVCDVAGLGMGLAMAYEIVSKHRGRLWVESTSGRGSVVSIELNCLGYLRHLSNGYGVIVYS
jgi:signal transduction histidine kinase